MKYAKDRQAAFQTVATLFIQYNQILQHIERCYDQIVHPQKRLLLRRVLDGMIGRILELKKEMVDLECSEYQYFEDVLSDLKLTPTDATITIPKYYAVDAAKIIKDRQTFITTIRNQMEGEKVVVSEMLKP